MISIVPYKPSWPNEFLEKGTMLRHILGDLAMRIDHIGSTSVPGLAAKDVIDIQITTKALTRDLESAMNLAGFNVSSISIKTMSRQVKLLMLNNGRNGFSSQSRRGDVSTRTYGSPVARINAMPFCFEIICAPFLRLQRHMGR